MNIYEKISLVEKNVLDSLEKLIKLSKHNLNEDDKVAVSQITEVQMSYVVFLKELGNDLSNDEKKKYTQSFLKKQFNSIDKSCMIVTEFYHEIFKDA